MVKQYPHSLVVTIPGNDTQDPTTGDIITGTPTTFQSECRAEVNSEAKVLRGADGQDVAYSFIAYLPKASREFPWGAKVVVTMSEQKTVEGKILGHSNGQLNTRIWL